MNDYLHPVGFLSEAWHYIMIPYCCLLKYCFGRPPNHLWWGSLERGQTRLAGVLGCLQPCSTHSAGQQKHMASRTRGAGTVELGRV